jgi:hypothetical protein
MHSYSSDSLDRRIALWVIAAFAVAVAFLYGVLSRRFAFSLPWWCETPSIILLYGLFHWVYDSWFWRKKVIGLRLSQIPNCSGTWFGKLRSTHGGGTEIDGVLVVQQTWSKIALAFRTDSSASYSRMAAVNVMPGALEGLVYEYVNDPRADASPTMHSHRGLAFLKLSRDCTCLEGEYYSGRDRGNCGTMKFYKVSPHRVDPAEARNKYKQSLKE